MVKEGEYADNLDVSLEYKIWTVWITLAVAVLHAFLYWYWPSNDLIRPDYTFYNFSSVLH